MTRQLTITLTMHLETDEATRPDDDDMKLALDATNAAIQRRLMGDGFLPWNLHIDSWSTTGEVGA